MNVPQTSPFTSGYTGQVSDRAPVTTLGQNDFLKLLVTKMTSQDPMNPQADTEFIAQMAQFSSLEQNKQMTGDIAALTANGLIGRTVTIKDGKETFAGVVSSVALKDGSPEVIVGGKQYSLSKVSLIAPYVPETPVA